MKLVKRENLLPMFIVVEVNIIDNWRVCVCVFFFFCAGCTNVCTLFQFVYGMFDSLSSPAKRKYLVDSR